MDASFQPAMRAAMAGSVEEFSSLLDRSPGLVTARSSCSHPTLLQFVVLEGGSGKIQDPDPFLRELVDRGAELNGPMVAAASIGSKHMASFLLASGASIEAQAPWTPLEESVYWGHSTLSSWLRSEHGAQVLSLRAAAGLGDVMAMDRFVDGGKPTDHAGPVRFPWGTVPGRAQDVVDQALVIAAKNGRAAAARRLLEYGADPGALPPGVHEQGSALHLAAMCGHVELVRILLAAGASPSLRDPEHNSTAAGWASHGGHPELASFLGGLESA